MFVRRGNNDMINQNWTVERWMWGENMWVSPKWSAIADRKYVGFMCWKNIWIIVETHKSLDITLTWKGIWFFIVNLVLHMEFWFVGRIYECFYRHTTLSNREEIRIGKVFPMYDISRPKTNPRRCESNGCTFRSDSGGYRREKGTRSWLKRCILVVVAWRQYVVVASKVTTMVMMNWCKMI